MIFFKKNAKKLEEILQERNPVKIKFSYSVKLALLAIIYFLTGKAGLDLNAVSGFAAPVWFPSGISLVALFLGGYRLWPGVFLGAFFLNLLTGAPFFSSVGMGIGNTLESVVGVYILNRMGFRRSLERVSDVSLLTLFAAPVSASVSASIGVISLLLGHTVSSASFIHTWISWLVGDILSIMIIAPFLLIWSTRFALNTMNYRTCMAGIGLTFIILIFSFFIFTSPPASPPIAYLIFPPLIWAALLFNPRFVITAVFFISMVTVWNTSHGIGPFVRKDLNESLLYLQIYMAVVSVSSFIFAAVMHERNQFQKRKDDFISLASHELKTPVTSMKIYIEILRRHLESSGDKKTAKVLTNIKGQTDKLKELVSDLLDMNRIETGKLRFTMENFEIDELVHEVIDGFALSTNNHTFIYKGKSKIIVYGDKFRIYQVLTNLISNAVKYSPQGGDVILKTWKEKNKAMVKVKDNGVGISGEQQEKIFDRLYQAGELEEKTFPGLGMGLFISKEIIKRHGGDIWVESEKGKGATFYFTLPFKKE